jgi:hypothetical protein
VIEFLGEQARETHGNEGAWDEMRLHPRRPPKLPHLWPPQTPPPPEGTLLRLR